ncbi:hypothetical protein PTSG_12383 [Salpingoeca rosetta]|uniref:EDRF1 N-terminal domain-containing protein n=1 Tax=Salpingoeca rosetta (strain ATCC 50818 / BSB-021) TaxID=946362 RepID=F2UDH5_SALR5|nr:uncharacterized protein PTSG_12383 [Salpingoeca rosetta]EGD74670.1 hypothetical protein PTSG_12383 [Salpingoeca rosetta]|eukprot:XP_004992927.1 hypothetical protein PTSG_12383 [Salpingoeca rosetta]
MVRCRREQRHRHQRFATRRHRHPRRLHTFRHRSPPPPPSNEDTNTTSASIDNSSGNSGSGSGGHEANQLLLSTVVGQAEQRLPVRSYWQTHDHLWSFHDIRSVVTSDLAIFGDGEKPVPAISLKLREDGQSINVLTGMDLWLDNLMCNVPEIMMCYHTVPVEWIADNPQDGHSRQLLELVLTRAAHHYATLAKLALQRGKFGSTVRFCDLCLRCRTGARRASTWYDGGDGGGQGADGDGDGADGDGDDNGRAGGDGSSGGKLEGGEGGECSEQ